MVFVSFLPQAQSSGTRCTITGTTKFLRFNYVPQAGAGYIENKSIIYIPKEAQCPGEFPLNIHLHGNNGRNDVNNYYLPRGTPGGQRSTEFGTPAREVESSPQVGTGDFQAAIETAMQNTQIPGMIFVIPANNQYSVLWTGLDGPALKRAVQQALDSNPETRDLRIRLSNDTLISGHSGAGCHGANSGILQLANMTPIAVGVLDICVGSVYAEATRRYGNSTILFYAASMAYSHSGYHNVLQNLGFRDMTGGCDPNMYIGVHDPSQRREFEPTSRNSQYWDDPILACAKHPEHNWYGIFATNTNHFGAVGKGLRTLLNITYSSATPPTTGAAATTGGAPTTTSAPSTTGPVSTTTGVPTQTLFTGGANVPLEAPIGGIGSIDVSGGVIVNYTRILFAYAGGIVGSLALLIIIVSGIQIMVSSGDLSKARSRLLGALGGLVLLAGSGWLLYLINPCFFTFGENPACTPRVASTGTSTPPAGGTSFVALPPSTSAPSTTTRGGGSGDFIVVDESQFVRVDDTCVHTNTPVDPSMVDPLRNASRIFCDLRGIHTDWRIVGGGFRSPASSLRLWLRRCINRRNCTIATGAPLQRSLVVRDSEGRWSLSDASLRALIPPPPEPDAEYSNAAIGPLYERLLPQAGTFSSSGHGRGFAIDVYCRGATTSQAVAYVPCQLLLEQAMKQAGFCRIPNEWWHFELASNHPDSRCDPNWEIGRVDIRVGDSSTPTVFHYASCANRYSATRAQRGREPCF